MATKKPVKKADSVTKKKPATTNTKKSNVKATTKKVTTSKKNSAKSTKKVASKKPVKTTKKSDEKKHTSEKVTETKKDGSYKIFAIVSAIIMIILALVFFNLGNVESEDTNKEKPNNTDFFSSYDTNTVLIIEDTSCDLCQVDNFALGVQAEIDPQATIIKLEYSDSEAQKFIETFNLNQVPIVLFSKTFENTEIWEQLSVAFENIEYNGNQYYQLTYNTPQIKKTLSEPKINEKTITIGNLESENIIYEFCSYETALCGLVNGNEQYLGEVREVTPEYRSLTQNVLTENDAKIVVLHVPQEENIDAYIAAFCAHEQGKYIEFRNSLYGNQFEWVPIQDRKTIFTNYALQLGINVNSFTSCLESNKEMYQTQLEVESSIAQEFDLTQFPSFIVNSYVLSGPLDFDSYKNILTQ